MCQKKISPHDGTKKEAHSWNELGLLKEVPFLTRLAAIYIVSFLVFWLCYILPYSSFILIARIVSGFIALIMIPGLAATSIILPNQVQNLSVSVLMGLVLQLFGIQLQYKFSIVFGIVLPIVYEVLTLSAIVTIVGFCYTQKNHLSTELQEAFHFDIDRGFIYTILVALAIRIGMILAAEGCLAPDASLYADFARNIIDGQFSSSTLNDVAVFQLTDTVDYIAHHAFTYVFAVSWLLIPPTSSGPVFILTLLGILLIVLMYNLVSKHFGKTAALWISATMAIHPLFIFHSAVGYGPEITSLVFLLFAALLLFDHEMVTNRSLFLSGLLLGLVDVIWYANFYVACFALPAVTIYQWRLLGRFEKASTMLLPMTAIARLFFTNWIMFYGVWLVVFILFGVIVNRNPTIIPKREILWLTGIAFIMIAWRWPLQLITASSGMTNLLIQTIPLVETIFSSTVFQSIPGFLLFLMIHISPGLLFLAILGFLFGTNKRKSTGFAIIGLIATIGTLMVLSTISGSLQLIYLYSDSRFFLLISLMFISSAAGYISHVFRHVEDAIDIQSSKKRDILRMRSRLLALIIILGLIPSYMLLPTGLTLINMEDRYGWKDLSSIINPLGNENTIFLANRVREFSWFTGRRCGFLKFSAEGLSNLNASLEMAALGTNFSAQYLLMDGYTITKWQTLEFLLLNPFSVGESINLNATYIEELQSYPNISIATLTLVGETEVNSYGRISRVFALDMLNPLALDLNLL
jgi:hypothetical protein